MHSRENALGDFESNAIIHDQANRSGNYQEGNKAELKVRDALKHIWHNDPYSLAPYLTHENYNVRCWAAMFWLEVNEIHALKTLKEIGASECFYSSAAKYCIKEWANGNLTADQWK
ncbi:MAG: hypothetical protein KJN70_05325 [Eudoraea sp.]|nr:hypothetical protein [Eudoraea sp.]